MDGRRLRQAGQLDAALHAFLASANAARAQNDPSTEAKAKSGVGSVQILLFQYRQALKTLQEARQLAELVNDRVALGTVSGNISVVYTQLGNFAAAEQASDAAVRYLRSAGKPDTYAIALINAGTNAFGLNHNDQAKKYFLEALSVAQQAKLESTEMLVADNYGIRLVLTGDLAEAEPLLQRAYQLAKKLSDSVQLAVTEEHLAELALAKGKSSLPEGLQHINAALAHKHDLASDAPYYPVHVRGQIELGLGQETAALADFRRAVQEADSWRQSALPGDATNTRTVAQLAAVYEDYADLLGIQAVQKHSPALAEEAFGVVARNRAASLREQLTRSKQNELLDSPEYLALLQQLQGAQAAVTLASNPARAEENRKKLDQIRGQLDDLENRLGLGQQVAISRISRANYRELVRSVQTRLGPAEAALSFSLGNRHSFLWAITSSGFQIYQLPGRSVIEEQARQFRAVVHQDISIPGRNRNRVLYGQALARNLFGSITGPALRKTDWLIAADGELLNSMPFSALPSPQTTDETRPLIADHNLRFLPSEILTAIPSKKTKTERFIGVGDPIYNRADTRWKTAAPPSLGKSVPAQPVRLNTLARLVGSDRELRSSAESSRLAQVTLLTGPEASGSALRQATILAPQILHFAVHVVGPQNRPGEAALALSLNKDNIPELLTAESVATYRVPGSLVVLSGCASQQGEIIPGSGLIGLSRSWLLAGASAVIVSAWPTPDDSGLFFSTFYRNYAATNGSVAGRAANALRQTQLAMRQAGGYRGDPSFWAAYSIVSKE